MDKQASTSGTRKRENEEHSQPQKKAKHSKTQIASAACNAYGEASSSSGHQFTDVENIPFTTDKTQIQAAINIYGRLVDFHVCPSNTNILLIVLLMGTEVILFFHIHMYIYTHLVSTCIENTQRGETDGL